MNGHYDDIIHLPHHVSSKRKPMSIYDRAAQFSPFAALTGHDAAIQETARLTDSRIQLDMDGIALLDAQIRQLAEHLSESPQITATCFVPDDRKDGGSYVTITGTVRKILSLEQAILLEDGRTLQFDRISRLEILSAESEDIPPEQ